MSVNPYQAYEQNSVSTASPGELTLMLYNGCLKFIRLAKGAISQKNVTLKNTNLVKAQNIIQKLKITLNPEIELSKDISRLYEYIYQRLIEANIKNDVEILTEVEGLVTEFRDTWKEVIQINRRGQHQKGDQI